MTFRSLFRLPRGRRLAAALALSLGISGPALATTVSVDFTDLWWNPNESGWGLNVIQQGDTIFATFFVYAPDQTPRWYVASGLTLQSSPSGTAVFGGKLYATTGPWFGGAFNPANVAATEVGTATLTFSSVDTATLVYNVDTTPAVTKQLTRQTWRNSTPVGRYLGGMSAVASACGNPANNGAFYIIGVLTATLANARVDFRLDYVTGAGQAALCTFTGTWVTQGRLGAVSAGTWTCSTAGTTTNNGTFTLSAVDVQVNGMTATFSASDQFCQYGGRYGGIRDVAG